eukprot:TRINITY_DN34220_c0_g1_i1.p1 TRINITY_DN34220_c0_g1~~TRINITY_DN34220_c0_g1_i1.p1  ORF type:complete len:362 (+),score=82.49 TRINITY_DN34220_c0_g1_i1:165-1088(+)
MNSSQKVFDIMVALEGPSKTPARYQTLSLDGTCLSKDQDLGGIFGKDAGQLTVMYQQAGKEDFVKAVANGSRDLVELRYMLSNGADVNAKADGEGRKPSLDDGIEEAQDKYSLSLAMFGASALHHAANHGQKEVASLILEEPSFKEINSLTEGDPSVEEGDRIKMTALHVAALNGHSKVCCLLLEDKRFDAINVTINEMFATRSALALACQKGLPEVVGLLLKDPRVTGINDCIDQYDTTILMLACCTNTPGHIEVCKMIFNDSRFTEYDLESCRGAGTKLSGTAYDIAKANGLDEIVQMWDKWAKK